VLKALEERHETTAPVRQIAEGGTFDVQYSHLVGSRILTTMAHNSDMLGFISKIHLRPGGLAAAEWMRSGRAVRDTPVSDHSAPGVNTMRCVAYCPPIAVSLFLLY
jgi:hypothetical protein